MGHARALIGVDDNLLQLDIYNRIIKEDLSVRKVEELVRKVQKSEKSEKKEDHHEDEAFLKTFEEVKNRLSSIFGSAVDFSKTPKGNGKITIPFATEDELNRIMGILESKQ